ncbi:hypothetical protein BDZ94DRAFT_1257656 [Collybia nuda]|uniref:Uncharacterized protein n=1 Tax=Collybia nuda TaxID=64659 RepID=A0A9P5Y7V3_9AGAR|nr:hypothetical protein BDZ94DRAFT_1257656 [Collybia nuda]
MSALFTSYDIYTYKCCTIVPIVSGVALSDVSLHCFEYSKSTYDSRHSQPAVVTVNRRLKVEDSESTRSPTATYFSRKIWGSPPSGPGGESSKSEVGCAC